MGTGRTYCIYKGAVQDMVLCVILLLFGNFSPACGKDDRDLENVLQFVLQEVQLLRSRMSALENVIENQNEIIRDQNMRLIQLEKLSAPKHSDGHAVEKTNLITITDNTKRTQLFNPKGSNQTGIEFYRRHVHLPCRRKGNQRIRRDTTRILAVQPIAFHAHMSSHLNNPGGHHTLIFDTVKTNEGNGYHPRIGVFIVPRSGTYFFTWTMSLYNSASHSTELVVNTVPNGAIYVATIAGQRDSATGNVILNVNEGDEIFIRTRDTDNYGQILSDDFSRTDFSGFLIE
ncbi:complement C1q and tumor necrosis factor-related protein 9B-like [Saccostrea echinata]|uniref:complement C1q and tumor necrosis factor-related protein 9B-like n=1 Tax=Saccostrea echinata TaxID=191078 RepID=UPI002A7EAE8D|nr:complement C1q and tumor necrosis factor-related protein 9B-like [Saccostrea echinata]